jgi:hypothetical protein
MATDAGSWSPGRRTTGNCRRGVGCGLRCITTSVKMKATNENGIMMMQCLAMSSLVFGPRQCWVKRGNDLEEKTYQIVI